MNWKRSLFTVLSPNLNGNTKSFLLILEMANISVKWHRTAFWNCKSLTWSWTETVKPIMPINCGQVRAVISRTIQKETNRHEWWPLSRWFLKCSILTTFETKLYIPYACHYNPRLVLDLKTNPGYWVPNLETIYVFYSTLLSQFWPLK